MRAYEREVTSVADVIRRENKGIKASFGDVVIITAIYSQKTSCIRS